MNEMNDHLFLALGAACESGARILEIYYSDEYGMEMKEDRSPVTDADRAAHVLISESLGRTGLPVLSEEGKEIAYEVRSKWKLFWMVDPLDGTKEFIRGNGEFTVNIALIGENMPLLGVLYSPVPDLMYFSVPGRGAFRCRNFRTAWEYCGSVQQLCDRSESLPREGETGSRYRVVASRSHLGDETRKFIRSLRKKHRRLETVSRGSALKFGLMAEGSADIYPRFGPTWEWDTAAGQAIVEQAGGSVTDMDGERLRYNKETLKNGYFVVRGGGVYG